VKLLVKVVAMMRTPIRKITYLMHYLGTTPPATMNPIRNPLLATI
jgi:hypothetical protein